MFFYGSVFILELSALSSGWAVHVVVLMYCILFFFLFIKCHNFFPHHKTWGRGMLPVPSLHDKLTASFPIGYNGNTPTGQMLMIKIFCFKKYILVTSCQRAFKGNVQKKGTVRRLVNKPRSS